MLSATARGTSVGNQSRAKAAEPEAITVLDTIEDAPEGELCSLEVNKAATALKPARCGASLSSIEEFPEEEPALAGIDEWKTPSPVRKIERKGESNLIDRSKKTTKNLTPIGRVDPNGFAALLGTDVNEEGKVSTDDTPPSSTTPSGGAGEKTEPTSTRSGFGSRSGFGFGMFGSPKGKFCSSKLLCVIFTMVIGLGCSAFALSSHGSGGVSEHCDKLRAAIWVSRASAVCWPEPVPGVCENGWASSKPLPAPPPEPTGRPKHNVYTEFYNGLSHRDGLHRTQWGFVAWNAWRLNISFEESRLRYNSSVKYMAKNSPERAQTKGVYLVTRFWASPMAAETIAHYRVNMAAGVLRQISYPGPCTTAPDVLKRMAALVARAFTVEEAPELQIVELGAGLAERGRCLAEYLRVDHGRASRLHIYDIATPSMQFLQWMCVVYDRVPCNFYDINEQGPPPFPKRTDALFVVEVLEHLHPADIESFHKQLLKSLSRGAVTLTSIDDHKKGGGHVNANLASERMWFASNGMREVTYDWPLQLPFSKVKMNAPTKKPTKKLAILLQNAELSKRITEAMAANQNTLTIRTSREFDQLGLDAVVRAKQLMRDHTIQIGHPSEATPLSVRVKLPKHQMFQRVGS